MVAGRGKYGIDTVLDGMLFAVVGPPGGLWRQGGLLRRSCRAESTGRRSSGRDPGTPPPSEFQPLGGIAVVARNTWAAIKGREALKITWDDGPNATYDSTAYKAALEKSRAPAARSFAISATSRPA